MFVASIHRDNGQKHFGLSMAEVQDKLDEYEEEMATRAPGDPWASVGTPRS